MPRFGKLQVVDDPMMGSHAAKPEKLPDHWMNAGLPEQCAVKSAQAPGWIGPGGAAVMRQDWAAETCTGIV